MYDTKTAGLIRGVPDISNLDPADLPRQLTEAYAKVVSARVNLKTLAEADSELSVKFRKMASTYESYVLTLEENSFHK